MMVSRGSTPLVTAPKGALPVLYQDEDVIVVNKPSGLSAHRGMSNERDYVLTRVRDQVGRHVQLVHRLDRATSGALLLTLEPGWVAPLQLGFQSGTVEKRYLALVRGVIAEHVHVDYAIPKGEDKPERVEARTTFRRLAVYGDRYSLIEAEPQTGRFHQIRRHASHLRHPIIGDTHYGDRRENRFFREHFSIMRLALHAHVLSFSQPRTGERISIRAPLSPDLHAAFAKMGFVEVLENETGHAETR
jgi:tRNA pseudouridine65 synthase